VALNSASDASAGTKVAMQKRAQSSKQILSSEKKRIYTVSYLSQTHQLLLFSFSNWLSFQLKDAQIEYF